MMTTGFIGGMALLVIGIIILTVITSIIRMLGPILMIIGIYYVFKTLKARNAQAAQEEPAPAAAEPEEFKDAAEILAEKYEGPNSAQYIYDSQKKNG